MTSAPFWAIVLAVVITCFVGFAFILHHVINDTLKEIDFF